MTAPDATTELLDFAVEIMREAGAFTLTHFKTAELEIISKGDGTPVTVADQGAERMLRERIGERFADDAVAGEEEADVAGTTGREWIIDPIDGTKAFTHGVPLYSGLLGLHDEHGPLVGVINLPAVNETVYAGRGLGCFCNGERVRVSTHAGLDGAYLMTSGFGTWRADLLGKVNEAGAHLRTWGDGYGYAMVATGRAEAMVDPVAAPWDLGPMPIVLSEAGGRFTSLEGADGHANGSGVATNGTCHDDWLELFGSAPAPAD